MSILALILISSICIPLVPTAQAVEPNNQTKSLRLLNDVIGINTENTTLVESFRETTNFSVLL